MHDLVLKRRLQEIALWWDISAFCAYVSSSILPFRQSLEGSALRGAWNLLLSLALLDNMLC